MIVQTKESSAQLFSSGNNSISGNNLGINHTAPTALFHIIQKSESKNGPALGQNIVQVQSVGSYSNIIGYNSDGTPIFAPLGSGSYQNTAKPYFIIDKSGFVGIDEALPKYKFHLNGTGYVSQNFYVRNRTGLGTETPQERLHVRGNVLVDGDLIIQGQNTSVNNNNTNNQIRLRSNGYIRAREIQVDLQAIPDYVFKADYNLMPLAELKVFVETNKHLPNVKSEAEFKEEGSISLTEMNLKLLEKVEELTLYVLDLQAQIDELKIK